MTIINWIPGLLSKNILKKRTCNILLIALFISIACKGGTVKEEKSVVLSNEKEIVSFVYHRFGDSRYPSTNVSLKDFKAHLEYLKNNNFQVLNFSDAIDYLKSDAPIQKTAVITIDDGYKSFYENGLPLLKKYDYPATLFINTETVGSGDYMNWETIKKAKEQRIEIGNHTHSHAYFLNMPESERYTQFEKEIEQTQQIIKKQLDFTPEVFAYPYGELDSKMKEIVEKSGFKAAAAQNSGVIYSGTDLMQCPRFPMSEFYSDIAKFKSKANMKALRIIKQSPTSALLKKETSSPVLTLTFNNKDIQINQLQCFIQGAECEIAKSNNGDSTTIEFKPKSAINQNRRTLYTITVPDKNGEWHWYSHLWVNPGVK